MRVKGATFEAEARSRLLVFPTMPIVVIPSKRRRLDENRDGGLLTPNFARSGPIDLPGTGYGSIRKEDRDVIKQLTGCSAAIRRRPSWNARKLTISGPRDKMRAAELAHRRGGDAEQQSLHESGVLPDAPDEVDYDVMGEADDDDTGTDAMKKRTRILMSPVQQMQQTTKRKKRRRRRRRYSY